MLTELYIEALLVNQELADQVWETWDAGQTSILAASLMWLLIVDGNDAPLFSLCKSCVNQQRKIHTSDYYSGTTTACMGRKTVLDQQIWIS